MEVRLAFARFEGDFDDRIEAFTFLNTIIGCRIEGQAVRPRAEGFIFREHLSAAAVAIGTPQTQHAPFAGGHLPLEPYRDVSGRLAKCGIQNVG